MKIRLLRLTLSLLSLRLFNRKERKGFTQSSQRNKVFLFCQSEFISDSVFIEMLKQVQHDNIMSGLIRVNS